MVVGTSTGSATMSLRFAGNRDLFLNMINWLSADEDLISIRPKTRKTGRSTSPRRR